MSRSAMALAKPSRGITLDDMRNIEERSRNWMTGELASSQYFQILQQRRRLPANDDAIRGRFLDMYHEVGSGS